MFLRISTDLLSAGDSFHALASSEATLLAYKRLCTCTWTCSCRHGACMHVNLTYMVDISTDLFSAGHSFHALASSEVALCTA